MPTCKANSFYDIANYSWENYCSYHESCLSKLRQYKSIDNIQEIERQYLQEVPPKENCLVM